MFYVSEINHEAPETFENETQRLIYEALSKLEIPFDRVTNDYIVSMEDCVWINEKLGTNIVKNLFLCNRQETEFIASASRPRSSQRRLGCRGFRSRLKRL